MTLDDFLTSENLTEAEFAKRAGLSQPHVNRMRHGKRFPSPDVLQRISVVTEGKVGLSDWYPSLLKAC